MIQVVLTMDTLELVPFEGTQLQRVEDIDAPKFHIKELRFKDLHKNLCKKPYFHARLDLQKRNSVAEGVQGNGEQNRSSLVSSDADYETCEDDGVASVPQDPVRVPTPSETHSEDFPAPDQIPSHRTSKREKRLPGKFHQDGNFFYDDFPDRYLRNLRRGVSKSKVKKHHPSPTKSTEVTPDHIPIQFFEVPIEAHEVDVLQSDATATTSGWELKGLGTSKVTDSYPCIRSEEKAPTRPLKQIDRSRDSSQKRVPATKHARFRIDNSECMEVSTDTEPHVGPSKTPKTSSMKRRHHSPDGNTEIVSTGKRAVYSKSKEKTSRIVGSTLNEQPNRTMGVKVKEKKGGGLLDSELKRTDIADGSIDEILPLGWRLTSPVTSSGEIVPTEKKATLESKSKEKKSRNAENKVKEKIGRTLESPLKRRNDAPKASLEENLPGKWKYSSPDASAGKRTLESKSKKEARTTESKWNEKKGRTPETESKRGHGGPDLRAEDILPMNWKLPKEKTGRTVESGSKQSYHGPDKSIQKVRPLKRKRGLLNASLEEDILPAEKKKTQNSKLNVKQSKNREVSFDASMEKTRSAAKQKAPGGKLKEKKSKTREVSSLASKEKNLRAESKKTADRKLEEKKSKTPESKVKVKKDKDGTFSPSVRIPIRKLKGGYTDSDRSSDVERDTVGPGTSYPTFATEMKHSNVITCFWMGIPAEFSSRHMPDHDVFLVLQDAKGLKWETNYLARKKGLSGGWRRFALDHHLEMGDIVVFELVKPLKFLVHITRGAGGGGENPNLAVHHPVREYSKKLSKHQASSATKRVSTLESALFSARKRVSIDVEAKLPSQKPRLAGDHKQQREGEKRASARLTPVVKPNRLYNSRRSTKDRDASSKDTEHVEREPSTQMSSEESEGEEELKTQRRKPLPTCKGVSSAEDQIKHSQIRKNPQELGRTLFEKSLSMSSPEPQKAGPLAPKPGLTKKKLRRVSYFYSPDEDQGNSIST